MENPEKEVFDIAIVGAGMVGLSLASALAPHNFKIAIIDRAVPPGREQWQGHDARVSAIVKSSENFLKNIGAWSLVEKERVCAYTGMEVWEQDGTAKIEFDAFDAGHTELGFIIENRIMQWSMLKTLENFSNVHWCCPASVEAFEKNSTGNWLVNFADTNLPKIEASLLVGADGALSFVRQSLGFEIKQKDLEHKAIVCNVECEKPHLNIARQIFLTTGPLAFLPLDGNPNLCSIVWSSDPDTADQLMALDDEAFLEKLSRKFEHKLGKINSLDKRFCFPLIQRHAESYIMEKAVLIGDAAHTIHPLAGQGVNLGYMDAAVLAEEILRARKRNISITSKEVLRRFERRRRGSVSLMMNAMRGFQLVFASKNPDFIGLRNLGVRLSNRVTPVKNQILNRAMGLSGDVPALAKGKE